MTIDTENIALFFDSKPSENQISTLEKALNELVLLEASKLENTQANCMMIWSTIELLSRFYSGQLGNQQATKRLKKYLRSYFPHHFNYTEVLILFRNACMHSISLYASDVSGKNETRFQLCNTGGFIDKLGRTSYAINVLEFKRRLLESIERYKSDLKTDEQLATKFEKVYRKIGYLPQ